MKYMLMLMPLDASADTEADPGAWSPDERAAHGQYMHQLDRELGASGERVAGEALAAPTEARLVRADGSGAPLVTDLSLPETKELFAGFWIVEVDGPERAYEIAARASAAPGPGGRPLNRRFIVRQVATPGRADD